MLRRHFAQFLNEDRAARLQPFDHIAVMHDLMADIDRRAVLLQRQDDNLNRPVNARAKTARAAEADRQLWFGGVSHAAGFGCWASKCQAVHVAPKSGVRMISPSPIASPRSGNRSPHKALSIQRDTKKIESRDNDLRLRQMQRQKSDTPASQEPQCITLLRLQSLALCQTGCAETSSLPKLPPAPPRGRTR